MELFEQLHADGQTIIIVTHENDVAGHCHRIIRLADGHVASDLPTDEDPIYQAHVEQQVELAAAGRAARGVAAAAEGGNGRAGDGGGTVAGAAPC
jgi:putative ABC transport system ATP-binding protein